ncbi:FkbM family methyltransferase [Streptantibioticus ferralitis]|uniref:FkbM family methyltransferase n=1 Tax=Streptantibioticus ferralitis TaxID=236510 RepID=A0ABT5YYX3_9ACTN|nr:FkbM family methyltransferase [Streptantibioticus ferralitis]MDF2256516.1 FkbM family methyltransferase [Streptantibioticus ferralitis]
MADDGIQLINLAEGFWCYTDDEATARFGYREIFEDDSYCFDLSQAPVVVDVGAGIGLFSLFVKRRYPQARVIAFEPVPGNVRLLRRNLALHGFADDVVVRQSCMGAQPAAAAGFTHVPRLAGNSTLHPEELVAQQRLMARHVGEEKAAALFATARITVEVEPFSQALGRIAPTGRIDLVKVDVEGAELDVLHGIAEDDWPRIGALLIEVGGERDAVERLLRERGLSVRSARAPYMWPELGIYNVSARR